MSDIMASKMDKYTIGILGGMGSYATSGFFERILDSFPAEKEWERPRIIIDNKCTMPSRVRALLYNENYDLLVEELASSVKGLMEMGATKLVLACNTSHCFLQEVLQKVPEAEGKIVNIIEACAAAIKEDGRDSAFLLATEGTIISKIYEKTFIKYDIRCDAPGEEDFATLREFIEAIKQKNISDEILGAFVEYINNVNGECVVLGCTELPILYSALGEKKSLINKKIYDPLDAAIEEIKKG